MMKLMCKCGNIEDITTDVNVENLYLEAKQNDFNIFLVAFFKTLCK